MNTFTGYWIETRDRSRELTLEITGNQLNMHLAAFLTTGETKIVGINLAREQLTDLIGTLSTIKRQLIEGDKYDDE